jgi:hypothetical protein
MRAPKGLLFCGIGMVLEMDDIIIKLKGTSCSNFDSDSDIL